MTKYLEDINLMEFDKQDKEIKKEKICILEDSKHQGNYNTDDLRQVNSIYNKINLVLIFVISFRFIELL